MTPVAILGALAAGALAGAASGLIGVGGGIVFVPFLYLVLAGPGWSGVVADPGLHAVLAHGTSLVVIVPTAVTGAVAYAREDLVAWRAVLPMAPAAVAAAVGGAALAVELPPGALKLLFGLLLVAAGIRLLASGEEGAGGAGEDRELRLGLPVTLGSGAAVGLVSSLLGVGGGIVAIPLLIHAVGLDLRRVAGTSVSIVAVTAAAGAVAYVVAGRASPGLAPGSVGYAYLPAALALLPGAVAGAWLGAAVNRRMELTLLRWTFAAFFIVVGLRLVVDNLGALTG